MNVFVFDIETVPDVEAGRRLYELPDLSDKDVAKAMFQKRREETPGSDFLRHPLQRIVAISAVFRHGDKVRVWSLGELESSEKELIQRFYDGIERYGPTLVSWNGGGFDLPVLHYRALRHGISAPRYWDMGEQDQSHRWNNYYNRYHWRHTDLMEALSGFQPRANAPLDLIATMLGFPGKMGMSGAKVWDAFHDGDLQGIRDYCETDVLNTYLVYQRFQLMRGHLMPEEYESECAMLQAHLKESDQSHFQEFLRQWQEA